MGQMKFTNTEVWGFSHAFRGMRNAYASWDKSDNECLYHMVENWKVGEDPELDKKYNNLLDQGINFKIGENDMDLAHRLMNSKFECDSKFLRMIHVSTDIDMPRYWWSEADTYHFNAKNSTSTMHKLLNNVNPITRDLFIYCDEDIDLVDEIVSRLEELRQQYKATKDYTTQTRLLVRAKRLLPEGFLQMRTFDSNYSEIRNMYFQRKNHRLKEEWIDTFCKWVESLPYADELITWTPSKEEQ